MWDPFEQTLKTFGHENLIQANPEAVEKLKIPERSKKFMTEIGLPKENILLCEFDLNLDEFPTVQEYARRCGSHIEIDLHLKRIGWDGGTQICLDESQHTGEVITIDIEGKLPTRFVNSNIETFSGFLSLFVADYCRFSNGTDKELDKKAFKLDLLFRELDPPAFNSQDTWWSCIAQQMKEGLL
ncbi:MAG: SUKH-4 family immunity protein [Sedimentisphaerales bacterium]|nr:SUKH-4 family immunity protein [Sedimentisphaerales bacterium]